MAMHLLQAEGWEQPRFHSEEYDPARSWYWRHAAQPPQQHISGDASGDAADPQPAGGKSAAEMQDAQRLVGGAWRAVAEAGQGPGQDAGEKALQRRERKKADKRRRRKLREAQEGARKEAGNTASAA